MINEVLRIMKIKSLVLFLAWLILFCLLSCKEEIKKENPEKGDFVLNKEEQDKSYYEWELKSVDQEKIAFISLLYEVDVKKAASVVAWYNTKIHSNNNADEIVKKLDTISNETQLPKKDIIKILFSYKYQLLTEEILRERFLQELIEEQYEEEYYYESESQY